MSSNTSSNPSGMPPQLVPSYVAGTNSQSTSAAKMSIINAQNQNNLIKNGGRRRRGRGRGHRGGAVATNASTITVPPVQAGAVNASQTESQYAKLTAVSAGAQENAKYDSMAKGGKRSRKNRRSRRRSRSSRSRSRRRR